MIPNSEQKKEDLSSRIESARIKASKIRDVSTNSGRGNGNAGSKGDLRELEVQEPR